jgi:hypothetical protein
LPASERQGCSGRPQARSRGRVCITAASRPAIPDHASPQRGISASSGSERPVAGRDILRPAERLRRLLTLPWQLSRCVALLGHARLVRSHFLGCDITTQQKPARSSPAGEGTMRAPSLPSSAGCPQRQCSSMIRPATCLITWPCCRTNPYRSRRRPVRRVARAVGARSGLRVRAWRRGIHGSDRQPSATAREPEGLAHRPRQAWEPLASRLRWRAAFDQE